MAGGGATGRGNSRFASCAGNARSTFGRSAGRATGGAVGGATGGRVGEITGVGALRGFASANAVLAGRVGGSCPRGGGSAARAFGFCTFGGGVLVGGGELGGEIRCAGGADRGGSVCRVGGGDARRGGGGGSSLGVAIGGGVGLGETGRTCSGVSSRGAFRGSVNITGGGETLSITGLGATPTTLSRGRPPGDPGFRSLRTTG